MIHPKASVPISPAQSIRLKPGARRAGKAFVHRYYGICFFWLFQFPCRDEVIKVFVI